MESQSEVFVYEEEAERLIRIADILKTVAHPIRLGIIRLLEIHPKLSVSDLCESLGPEQSLTSHHLKNMRLKGLLSVKREGRSTVTIYGKYRGKCLRLLDKDKNILLETTIK